MPPPRPRARCNRTVAARSSRRAETLFDDYHNCVVPSRPSQTASGGRRHGPVPHSAHRRHARTTQSWWSSRTSRRPSPLARRPTRRCGGHRTRSPPRWRVIEDRSNLPTPSRRTGPGVGDRRLSSPPRINLYRTMREQRVSKAELGRRLRLVSGASRSPVRCAPRLTSRPPGGCLCCAGQAPGRRRGGRTAGASAGTRQHR